MIPTQFFCIHATGLVLLLVISVLTLRHFHQKRFSTAFGGAYLAFILIVSCLYFSREKDAQAELYWIIPATLTFPVSLLLLVIRPGSIGAEGVALLLTVFGTIQYWGIGLLIDRIIEEKKKAIPRILLILIICAVTAAVLPIASYCNAIRVANAYVSGAPDGPYVYVTGRFVVCDGGEFFGVFDPCWALRYDNPASDDYARIYVNLTGTKVGHAQGLSPMLWFGEYPPSRWYGPGGTRTKDKTKSSNETSNTAPSAASETVQDSR
jgi:hypothetical protein